MQCQIRGMAEATEGTQSVDTLPKPGRVNEVCREWLVKEDGALAYRLQSEEIEHHLSGNRWRNAVVREDFPRALDEQRREQELAEEVRRREALLQEEYDARVATELAERIEREEAARRAALETHDQHVAWKLQERERRRVVPLDSPTPPVRPQAPAVDPDPNCVGLPPPPDDLSARVRVLRIHGTGCRENMSRVDGDLDAIEDCGEDEETAVDDDEEARRVQEERDAELARILQEREATEVDPHKYLSDLDRDRLIALEAQDRELARLLQEKERAKARRAREKARQRAVLKRQQQQQQQQLGADADAILPAPSPSLSPSPPPLLAVRPTDLDLTATCRPDSGSRFTSRRPQQDVGYDARVYVASPDCPSPTNIAAAIDPTYRRGSGTLPSSAESIDLGSPALPYMPIQGQRRCPPQPDKRSSRKEAGVRDTCRQQ